MATTGQILLAATGQNPLTVDTAPSGRNMSAAFTRQRSLVRAQYRPLDFFRRRCINPSSWRVGRLMVVEGVHSTVGRLEGVAFGDFYRSELDGQVRRAVLLLGSNDLANDVVHDAFIEVYRRWDTLDEPGPYLHVAVLNRCRGIHRQRSRHRRLLPRLTDRDSSASVGEHLDDLLAELPFNQRAAVVLRFYVGLTTDEIAGELGCAPGSVGPWINRALAKMRKALQ